MSNSTGDAVLRALVQTYQSKRESAVAALTVILNNTHHTDQLKECEKYLEQLSNASSVLTTLSSVLQQQQQQAEPTQEQVTPESPAVVKE